MTLIFFLIMFLLLQNFMISIMKFKIKKDIIKIDLSVNIYIYYKILN